MTPRPYSGLLRLFLLALAYFAAGKLGLMLALVHPSATAVWPPTGIALAALLVLGGRVWPAVFLGAFLVNLTTAGSWATSLAIAAGNTLEAIVGASLVDRFAGGRHCFDRTRDLFKFAILAAGLSTALSASVGVTSLCLAEFARWSDFGAIWTTWWLGDAVGALVVAPAILVWVSRRRLGRSWRLPRVAEALALFGLLALTAGVVFAGLVPGARNMPLEFLCVPPLLGVAYRFGRRETTAAVVLLAAVAIGGTLRGLSPFLRDSVNESLLLLQAYLGVVALTALALSVAVSERRQTERALALMESAVRDAAQGVVILASEWRPDEPRIIFANEQFARMMGRGLSEILGETLEILDVTDTEGAADAMRHALSVGERFDAVVRARRRDGLPYAMEIELTPAPSDAESTAHWIVLVRDVSERMAHLDRLEHQALYDFLTGLPNRVLLRDRLGQAILGSEREGVPLGLFLMDLDGFKQVNDTFGHHVGDLLLQQIGPRLKGVLRNVDTVARMGGDEFAILLPQHGTDFGALLRAADAAMYAAKRRPERRRVYEGNARPGT